MWNVICILYKRFGGGKKKNKRGLAEGENIETRYRRMSSRGFTNNGWFVLVLAAHDSPHPVSPATYLRSPHEYVCIPSSIYNTSRHINSIKKAPVYTISQSQVFSCRFLEKKTSVRYRSLQVRYGAQLINYRLHQLLNWIWRYRVWMQF